MDSATFREFVKALVAEGALALLIIYGFQVRHRLKKHLWLTGTALVLIAAVAVAGYFEFGWKRYGTFMNNHDFYHYYTGTKYAKELGYYNQYGASLLADHEQKRVFDTSNAIRNLETHGYTPTAEVFANKDAIKGRFSPERWEAFKKDIRYFQERVPDAKWQRMLRDKGYNGTPVWSMTTGTLTNLVSTDSEQGMWTLVALDQVVLAVMFAAIWWAFGPWTALFALAFFGTNFVMSFVHIKGALLRMDWVACLGISMCLLHKRYFKTAGVVLAYAAAARVFPAIFAFGVGALACWELLATRKINRDYVRFFGAFALTIVLLLGASWVYFGTALWQEFFAKIGVHNSDISTTRIGFKYIFLWPFESFGAKVQGFEDNQRSWWIIQAVMLAITFIAARKMKPYQALGFGFVPAFFLTAPTFYYYVYLVVPLLVFLPTVARASHAAGAALFFAASTAAYILHVPWNLDFPLCFAISCMYGLIALYMTGLHLLPDALLARLGRDTEAPTAASEDVSSGAPVAMGAYVPQPVPAGPPSWRRRLFGLAYAGFIIGLFVMYRADPEDRARVADTSQDHATAAPTGPNERTESPRVPATRRPVPTSRPEAPSTAVQEAPPPAATGPSLRLALVGDVMMSRNVERDLKKRDLDFTYPFAATAPMLQTADIAFANLECPISGRGERVEKNYTFNAPPEAIEGLKFAGFDLVSLANNHTLDYGTVALEDTLKILDEAEIRAAGIATGDAPQEPVVIERRGLRVGFLAYADPKTPYAYAKEFLPFETGPAKAVKETIARDIAALKERVDAIVVSLHWGIEYQDDPDERQQDLGQFCIDQGAAIVAGHHPHVQQEAQWYNDGLIIYSMGNFVFDQWSRPKTRMSRLYTVTLTADGPVHAQYRELEIIRHDWQPRPTGPRYVPVLKSE